MSENRVDVYRFIFDRILLVPSEPDKAPVDLSTFVDSLDMYESLNQMFVQGSMKLTLPKGYLSSVGIKIRAQDALDFQVRSINTILNNTFQKNETNISCIFYINQVTSTEIDNEIYDKMNLNFVSIEAVKDKSVRIQKSYKNQKRSDIIREIYESSLQSTAELSGNAETDDKDFFCVIPNWSPSKTINWLKMGCKENDIKNFYFFQRINSDGELETVFENFKNLCNQKPTLGNEDDPASGYVCSLDVQTGDDELDSDYESRMKAVIGKPVIMEMDFLDKSTKGVWASTCFFYDITTKKYTTKKYNYKDSAPSPLLNSRDEKFITDNIFTDFNESFNNGESSVFLFPKAYLRFDSEETELGADRFEEWYQDHISQKETSIFNAISIETVGDTNRRVGETVMFSNLVGNNYDDENSQVAFQSDDGREYGGKYLIFAIQRHFEFPYDKKQGSCTNKMILVKDGLARSSNVRT